MITRTAVLGSALLCLSVLACEAPAQAEARGYPASPGDSGTYVAPVYGCVPDAFKVISLNNDPMDGDGLYVVWNPRTGAFAESTSDAPCAERIASCRQAVSCDELLDWRYTVCVTAWGVVGAVAGAVVGAGCIGLTRGTATTQCAAAGAGVGSAIAAGAGAAVCNPDATIGGAPSSAAGTGGAPASSPAAAPSPPPVTVPFAPPVDVPVTPASPPPDNAAPACWGTPYEEEDPPEEEPGDRE